jgi:type III secretion protein J
MMSATDFFPMGAAWDNRRPRQCISPAVEISFDTVGAPANIAAMDIVKRVGRRLGLFALCGLALVGAGCGKTVLYSNVRERQANEMIALLRTKNMAVDKVPGLEGAWSVVVVNSQFASAMDVLNNHGFPRDQFNTMGQIFQKSGLVSSPTEERARFMYALSESLAETISHIAGVVTARVSIVLPESNPYTEVMSPSSAAVFVSYRPGSNIEDAVRDIKYLVTNSIEGLSYDKVSVALFPAPMAVEDILPENEMVNVLAIHMTRASLPVFFLILLIVMAATAALSLVGAKVAMDYLAVRKEEKRRKQQDAQGGEGGGEEGEEEEGTPETDEGGEA